MSKRYGTGGRDERGLDRWLPIVAGLVASALFIAAVAFFAWRDHRATARCEALGGVTWDSGQHCVIGERVIDTHDRTWG